MHNSGNKTCVPNKGVTNENNLRTKDSNGSAISENVMSESGEPDVGGSSGAAKRGGVAPAERSRDPPPAASVVGVPGASGPPAAVVLQGSAPGSVWCEYAKHYITKTIPYTLRNLILNYDCPLYLVLRC